MSRYKIRPGYDKEVKLEVNAAECKNCGDILFSRALHDFRTCTCGKTSVDGGLEYFKVSGVDCETYKLKIVQTKQELYDDWNKSENKYGHIVNKEYEYCGIKNTGYGRTVQMSERKKKRGGFNSNGNRDYETILEKIVSNSKDIVNNNKPESEKVLKQGPKVKLKKPEQK